MPPDSQLIPLSELIPGEIFSFDGDNRLRRFISCRENERPSFATVKFGNIGNSEGVREATFCVGVMARPLSNETPQPNAATPA